MMLLGSRRNFSERFEASRFIKSADGPRARIPRLTRWSFASTTCGQLATAGNLYSVAAIG